MTNLEEKKREQWGSRVGFILAAAGSAVGLGNIWRFSYVVGENGGGAFVLIYLFLILFIGYPLMVTEMTLGQETGKNPIGAFKKLAPDSPWWISGALGVLAAFVILSFYSVIGGWSISYFFKTIFGNLNFASAVEYESAFDNFVQSPIAPLIWHGIFMGITLGIIAAGISNGIEKIVKILMPILFVLLVALVIRGLTLDGAMDGVSFYLKPNLSDITAGSILGALGQSFFTLSLGMGAMITYGSYLNKKEDISDNAAWVVGLDVFVALLAGLAIFPAVFALGFEPDAGTGLAFITLPAVFAQMPLGTLFGAAFFGLLTFAAITSSISLLEVVVSWLIDEKGYDRKKASLTIGFLIFLLGIPASLSLGVWSDYTLFDMNFFSLLDFFQESILLPLGALLTSIFAGHVLTAERTRQMANKNANKIKLGTWFDFILKYVLPIVILIVMIFGLLEAFDILVIN